MRLGKSSGTMHCSLNDGLHRLSRGTVVRPYSPRSKFKNTRGTSFKAGFARSRKQEMKLPESCKRDDFIDINHVLVPQPLSF